MKTYRLVREQIIPRPLEDVFGFFADARNLESLTPPWLRFQILTPGDIEMRVGTIIQYTMKVHGICVNWTSAITVWNPPFEFVDVQQSGPYALWHHRHRFESLADKTRMTDDVTYALPFAWLGRAMHSLLVQRDLDRIFRFREKMVSEVFDPSNPKPLHLRRTREAEPA